MRMGFEENYPTYILFAVLLPEKDPCIIRGIGVWEKGTWIIAKSHDISPSCMEAD